LSKIIIIGLGPGNPEYLTREALRCLVSGHPVFFRTMHHPSARFMAGKTAECKSFDSIYEKGENFNSVYRLITERLMRAAKMRGTICYAVPGHPLVGEATVERLMTEAPRRGIKVRIVEGLSFLEPVLTCLEIDMLDGVTVIDALSINNLKEPVKNHLVIAQVYNRTQVSRVKLALLELYPADYPVKIVREAGTPGQRVLNIFLGNLDRAKGFNHLTTVYLPPYKGKTTGDLVEVMSRLRSQSGCPWDKKQDHNSLRQYLVEEAYEVVAAIDRGSDGELMEELGDVLLQVVFHSQIAKEENRFDYYMVVNAIVAKLIRRHPHVFGDDFAENPDQVKVLWEQIKVNERSNEKPAKRIEVDQGLPALLKAYKLQKKAAEMGFDWPTVVGPLDKAREELAELEEACRSGESLAIEEELGDFLFTIVNMARFLKVNPELALGKTITKFYKRFGYVLEKVDESGKPISDFSLEELDKWWEDAKKIRKKRK